MYELNPLHLHAVGQSVKPRYVFLRKSLLHPEDHLFRGGLDVPVRTALCSIVVVVSADGLDFPVADKINAFLWGGAVPDDVPGADNLVTTGRDDGLMAGSQRFNVAMYVAYDSQPHADFPMFVM